MGTQRKTAVFALVGCAIAVTAAAQTQPPSASVASLDRALYRSVCERIQAPMVFSTRDTTFALSLPTDEPAMVSLQVTVAKNGKVKEKLTRVDANHIAGFVAPAFLAATKGLAVDRSLLGNLTGKDTSLTLTFPLEYQCVYDTINKEWPSMTPKPYWSPSMSALPIQQGGGEVGLQQSLRETGTISMSSGAWSDYRNAKPTRVWYYLAFIKDQSE